MNKRKTISIKLNYVLKNQIKMFIRLKKLKIEWIKLKTKRQIRIIKTNKQRNKNNTSQNWKIKLWFYNIIPPLNKITKKSSKNQMNSMKKSRLGIFNQKISKMLSKIQINS